MKKKAKGRVGMFDVDRVEALAKLLHESGRKAVELGQVVNDLGQPFLSWVELTPKAQEGRRMAAKFMLDKRRRKTVRRLFA